MKSIKYLLSIVIVFIWTVQVFSQVKKDSEKTNNSVEEISTTDLVHFANNSELISEIQSSNLHIKIYKVRNGIVGVDEDFLSKDFDLYIAVTTNKSKNLFKVADMQNVRDVKWLEIGEIPEFRCNYAGSSHTRTARFKIYSDKVERLY